MDTLSVADVTALRDRDGDGVSASEMRYVEDSLNAYKNKMLHDLQAVMDSYGVAIKDVWNGSDSEEERVLIKDAVTKRFLSCYCRIA